MNALWYEFSVGVALERPEIQAEDHFKCNI